MNDVCWYERQIGYERGKLSDDSGGRHLGVFASNLEKQVGQVDFTLVDDPQDGLL
ncbi:hypothetical protein ACN9MI_18835 [Rhodococcoides fascians]|uniref:hypothetical protein n=1 Tax=Rhodococcoides fascians TaxID=1828 RepID=UPI003CEC3B09